MFFDTSTIDSHFPLPNYREGQKECIEFILNSYNSGKRIVIIECPTGSGKSIIGMTVANMVRRSFYLTITKQLQSQLKKDFDDVTELKGRNAYPCTFYDRYGHELISKKLISQAKLNEREKSDCSIGFCKTPTGIAAGSCTRCFVNSAKLPDVAHVPQYGVLDILPPGMKFSACPYYEQVYRALNSNKVIMNFSSFLYQTAMTKRFNDARDLMIIDESHQLEPQLLDFVSLTINDYHLKGHGIFIPKLDSPYEYAIWFEEINIKSILANAKNAAEKKEDFKSVRDLESLQSKIKLFMEHISNTDAEWVFEYVKGKVRSVTLKPVHIMNFAGPLLFKSAKLALLMSATILDIGLFCRSLGFDRSEVATYRMKNRFPVKNRPIYIKPLAKFTGGQTNMHSWMPILVKGVEDIVRNFKDQRGIIHTHNFAIMDALMKNCAPDVSSRFLCQRNFDNKDKLLEEHGKSIDSVIIAPAMHEGVDLIDDLSRFQIICKIPYPNFYDNKQLIRRMELDNAYYPWLTALKLIQSTGRSVRSETDYAETYILDESIHRFLRETKRILPPWFSEALFDESGSPYTI